MYVRAARKREEVWLLDRLEEFGMTDPAFRSRDYVFAVDEETGEKAGFGRLRVHTGERPVCEVTNIGVLDGWRDQGVGAHVVERLVDLAGDQDFDVVYSLTAQPAYLAQFGFERVDEDDLPDVLRERLAEEREATDADVVAMAVEREAFAVPDELRRRFKRAHGDEEDDEPEESPEDFGIDPDSASYKYDTGD